MLYTSEGTAKQADVIGIPESVIIDVLNVVNACIIYACCCLAIVIWDWISLAQLEYRAIWSQRWSLTKVLYINSRIWVLIATMISIILWTGDWTREECNKIYRLQVALGSPTELLGAALLFIRAYAVSYRAQWVLIVLGLFWLVELGYFVFIAAVGMTTVPVFSLNGRGYCIATGGPHGNAALAFWVFPLVGSTLATVITLGYLRKAAQHGTVSDLFASVRREGLVYYGIIVCVNLINIGFFASGIASSGVNAPFSLAITAIMSCRLVLSLHRESLSVRGSTRGGSGGKASASFWAGRSTFMQPQVPLKDSEIGLGVSTFPAKLHGGHHPVHHVSGPLASTPRYDVRGFEITDSYTEDAKAEGIHVSREQVVHVDSAGRSSPSLHG